MDVRFLEGIEANLPTTITDGNIYYCTDTAKLYIDMNGERKCVSSSSSDENKYLWRQWEQAVRGSTTSTLYELTNIEWSSPYYYTGTFDDNGNANGTETKVNFTYNDGVIIGAAIYDSYDSRLSVGNEISVNMNSSISLSNRQTFDASNYKDSTREANFEPYYVVDTGINISVGAYFYFASTDSASPVYSPAEESIQLQMIATLDYDSSTYAYYVYRWCIPKDEITRVIPDTYRIEATYVGSYISPTPTLFESDNSNFMTNSETDTLLTESLGKRGELEKKAAYIELGSYVGTGNYHTVVTLTFSSCPKIVMISTPHTAPVCSIVFKQGGVFTTASKTPNFDLTGNKLTFKSAGGSSSSPISMNNKGVIYNVIAIY